MQLVQINAHPQRLGGAYLRRLFAAIVCTAYLQQLCSKLVLTSYKSAYKYPNIFSTIFSNTAQ